MAASSQYQRRPVARSRNWVLRSFVTKLAGLMVAMGAATFGGSLVTESFKRELLIGHPVIRPEEVQQIMMEYSESVGVDLLAPIHEQFLDVLATRVLHPIILGPLLLAGVVAVYLTWRHRCERYSM